MFVLRKWYAIAKSTNSRSVCIALCVYVLHWKNAEELIIQTLAIRYCNIFFCSQLSWSRDFILFYLIFHFHYFQPTHRMVILLICCTEPFYSSSFCRCCVFFVTQPPTIPECLQDGTIIAMQTFFHEAIYQLFVYSFYLWQSQNCDLIFWHSTIRCYETVYVITLAARYCCFVGYTKCITK